MSKSTRKSSSFKSIILVFALPILLLSMTSAVNGGGDGLKIGMKAPMTTTKMKAVDGNEYSLSDLKKENGLIVMFSCNTCPFVVGSSNFEGWEKQYNELHKLASEHNIGMVLINSNQAKRDGDDSMEEMINHAKDANYNMAYVVDENSSMANAFGAKTTPHVYVINAKDKLVYKGSVDNSWDTKRKGLKKYLYSAIDYLAHGTDMKENSTTPRGCSIKRVKIEH
jgi:peroxiredoxin